MNWYTKSLIKEAIRALSPKQKQSILNALQKYPGQGYTFISQVTKIPSYYIKAFMSLNGYENVKRNPTVRSKVPMWANPEIVKKVMDLYNKGTRVSEITKALQMPYASVERVVRNNKELKTVDDYVGLLKFVIWDKLSIGFKDILDGTDGDFKRLVYIGKLIDQTFKTPESKQLARQALIEKLNIRGNLSKALSVPGINQNVPASKYDEPSNFFFDEPAIQGPQSALQRNFGTYLTKEEITKLLQSGKTKEQIATMYKVSLQRLESILNPPKMPVQKQPAQNQIENDPGYRRAYEKAMKQYEKEMKQYTY